jgi:hypothetical protein
VKTYRIEVAPTVRYRAWGPAPAITQAALAKAIGDVVIREIVSLPNRGVRVDAQLQRDTHEAALGELVQAVEFLGYELIKAEVTEWVTSWVEGTLIGALGGAAVGSATRNVIGFFVSLAVGAGLGGAMGYGTPKVAASFRATRDYFGRWTLTPVVQLPPEAPPTWAPA